MKMKNCLIVVDVQYDFCNPNGSLYVKNGETIIPLVDNLIEEFSERGDLVVATKDWHPEGHISFEEWPKHCIQNTVGACLMLHKEIPVIIKKGTDVNSDSYSGFYSGAEKETELANLLQEKQINRVFVVGLAWEYCVLATARDAVARGYETYIITDATKAVGNNPALLEEALSFPEIHSSKLTQGKGLQ